MKSYVKLNEQQHCVYDLDKTNWLNLGYMNEGFEK